MGDCPLWLALGVVAAVGAALAVAFLWLAWRRPSPFCPLCPLCGVPGRLVGRWGRAGEQYQCRRCRKWWTVEPIGG